MQDAEILQMIFADAPLPVAIYDRDGQVRRANPAHDAFALGLGEAAGIGDFSAMDDLRSERKGHRAYFVKALKGEVVDYQFEVQPGPELPLSHFSRMLLPVAPPGGQVQAVVSILVDISDRVDATGRQQRMERELLQTQKLDSLGLLAGGIAHDFNNILVGVLGNASLLLRKLDRGSPLRRYAEAIETAGRRAGEVAHQLLAYAGKGQFRRSKVNLTELVQETSELVRISVSKRAQLHHELAMNLPQVHGDATQLRQIVMNLITNAGEACKEPGGEIMVRTGVVTRERVMLGTCFGEPDPTAKRFVFVEVQDNGSGMDDAIVSRVFDPFFTTKFAGRGLGLSVVLGIVSGHRGALKVDSAPGQGTTMCVLLPIDEHPAGPAPRREPTTRERRILAPGVVLVVDDEPQVRSLLENMLGAMDMQVVCADGGRAALEFVEDRSVQLDYVLMDLTMPGMDGNATYRALREIRPDLPVIFMSGYEEQSVPEGETFVQKPFTYDDLTVALKRAGAQAR